MNEKFVTNEFVEKLKKNPDYTVIEKFEPDYYGLIVMYKDGSTLCSRGTFRRPGCKKYIGKRLKYLIDLSDVMNNRNLQG